MIASTGIDIAEVGRIEQAINRWGQRFLDKVFTPSEIAFCPSAWGRVLGGGSIPT